MKTLILIALLLVTPVFAQSNSQDTTKDDRAMISELQAQIKELQTQLQAVGSTNRAIVDKINAQPITKEQRKAQRKQYDNTCQERGYWFSSIDINTKTGDIILHCI